MVALSQSMTSNLAALLQINDDLRYYNVMATTGKRINAPGDGYMPYTTALAYDNRVDRLNMMNDTLSQNLFIVSANNAGLENIHKTLLQTRDILQKASSTSERIDASIPIPKPDSDPGDVAFDFSLQARTLTDRKRFISTQNPVITDDTRLSEINHADTYDDAKNYPAGSTVPTVYYYQSAVFIGGQAMRGGMKITITAGTKTWTFNIGNTDDTRAKTPQAVDDARNASSTVYTVGQLLDKIKEKIGLTLTRADDSSASLMKIRASYSGPSFEKNTVGEADLTRPLGLKIAADYAISPGLNRYTTYDQYGFTGVFDLNSMFTPGRRISSDTEDYVTDASIWRGKNQNSNPEPTRDEGSLLFKWDLRNNVNYMNQQTVKLYAILHSFLPSINAQAADPARSDAAKAYRDAIETINDYYASVSQSGKNLLDGSIFKVASNETGQTENFQITDPDTGVPLAFNSAGFNMTDVGGYAYDAATDFDKNRNSGSGGDGLLAAIEKINRAIHHTNYGTAILANFTSTLNDRKSFNTALSKVLTQGSTDLTSVNMTEVAATISALQVQQNFAQNVLQSIKMSNYSLIQFFR